MSDTKKQPLTKTTYQVFHSATNIDAFNSYKIPEKRWPSSWKKIYHKAYPKLDSFTLPNPSICNISLIEALMNRHSTRDFSGSAMNLETLSSILYFSSGLKIHTQKDIKGRFYPSAGARYPLEVYPALLNVKDCKKMLCHYHLKSHSLEVLLRSPFYQQLMRQFDQKWIRKSSAILLITGMFRRTTLKYSDRGYRHVITEYGHLAQNIYLLAQAYGVSCCSVGGYIDNGLNRLLDLDYEDEAVVGVVCLG